MSFLRKGTLVDRFKVVSRLDKGKRAYREVYLTTTPIYDGDDEKCVLVIYDYDLTREMRMLPKSGWPYEVGMMPFLFDDSDELYWDSGEYVNRKGRRFCYAVYSYREGLTLNDLIISSNQSQLNLDFFAELCRQIHAVSLGVGGGGHNAISPDNIIAYGDSFGFRPLLIDFSNAWLPVKRKRVCDVETIDHRFRAPETFVGGFSKYSDIYSFGMLLCYFFNGSSIWDYTLDDLKKMNEKQRRKAIENMRVTALERSNFPEQEYREIVEKALNLKPEDRFRSALEMMYVMKHTSTELREFDELCDRLEAKELKNWKNSFDKDDDDDVDDDKKESDDFDKLLDDFIKTQLSETDDLADKTLKDDLAKNSVDDNDADDNDNMSFDHDFFDFAKRDDGSLSVNVSPKKRKGNGFADVAGMASLKQLLKRNFIDIVRHRDKAKKYNIQPSNGILLYGPPGCGKTFIAEKIAEEANLSFVMVKPSDLGSTYVHGSQTKIADLFKKAEKEAPALICFDEFDALVPTRTEDTNHNYLTEINEFLVQLNNCASRGIYVLAMTNNINMIDSAVMRKGRIDEVIYVPEPDTEARSEMFRIELKKCDLVSENIDFDKLSDMTRGYTSSDISYIVMEASREAFRSAIEIDGWVEVDQSLLERIIQQTSPSISEKDIKHYESMRDEFVNKKKQIEIRPRIGFAV